MMRSNWARSHSNGSPLFLSQLAGLTAIVLVGILFYFFVSASYWNKSAKTEAPLSERKEGTIAVELSGDVGHPGIYYVPAGTTVAALLQILALTPPQGTPPGLANHELLPGMTVIIEPVGRLRLGEMGAGKRLALDLPLDVNTATADELMLIPGVKEATAEKILTFRRNTGGRLNRIEDLLQVPGIKEKRFDILRKYLYVADSPGKRGD